MTKRHEDELIRAALRSRQKGTFSMIEFTYTVQDPNGMHARPAGRLATVAKQFLSDVRVRTEEKEADAKGRKLKVRKLVLPAPVTITREESEGVDAVADWIARSAESWNK